MTSVIEVAGLHKAYGDFEAVRGVDFAVSEGEIFGLLGPNGAGKTTTVEILEGLRTRSQGQVKVLGFDPEVSKRSLKDRIGVCLQATNLPDKLRVHEALEWFAAFYSHKADSNKLLQRLQLWDKRNEFYSKLSGGQKQRVALALALANEPSLVFLDEPTTGLDPQVRLEIHTLIEELKAAKRTVLLTTHYIEEAERLCDRVAIIDSGQNCRHWARLANCRSASSASPASKSSPPYPCPSTCRSSRPSPNIRSATIAKPWWSIRRGRREPCPI